MKIKLTTLYVDDQEKALHFIQRCWALPRRPISATAPIAG